MAFFNPQTASVLQYFTFPLEVIGLTLAYIEVRHPSLAARMAAYFEIAAKAHDRSGLLSEFWQAPDFETFPHRREKWPWNRYSESTALKIQRATMVLPLLLFTVWAVLRDDGPSFMELAMILLAALGFMVVGIVLGRLFFATVNRLADRWVPGRAVGTLGILIASLGVLGELYQLVTQILA